MNDYQTRKAAKAERYRQFADNAAHRAEQLGSTAREMADVIPFGQPILVGHYSERRDRRYRDRIFDKFGKSVEEQQRAEYWARRAAAVENDTSISSQDPDAPELLRAKIAELEAQRDRMKAVNAAYRKRDDAKLAQLGAPSVAELDAKLANAYSWCKAPHPTYELANLGANIRRYQQRLTALERPPTWRVLVARRSDICVACGGGTDRGESVLYDGRGNVKHTDCAEGSDA